MGYCKIIINTALTLFLSVPSLLLAGNINKTVTEVISQCDNKYAGEDQSSIFIVTIKNKRGQSQRSIYKRYWKKEKNSADISDKLSLFTLSPADAKNTAFLQYSFIPGQKKNAEQWLYLPSLRSTLRTTIRDLNDRFLGSDLTFDDIRSRQINEDNHSLLDLVETQESVKYLVESRPKESTSQYSRKVILYEKNKKTDACLKIAVTYYNKHKGVIKEQTLNWQKVGSAWLWKTVVVKNAQTFGSSTFQISKAKVNSGLEAGLFTTRILERGIPSI